jgi:hypothetical protein
MMAGEEMKVRAGGKNNKRIGELGRKLRTRRWYKAVRNKKKNDGCESDGKKWGGYYKMQGDVRCSKDG